MTARIRLDPTRCAGHGICALILAGQGGLDGWGFPDVDGRPVGDAGQGRRARRAVAACPRRALSLVEDPPGPAGPSGAPLRP